MRYLNKVVFVNSAHVPYAEVKVDGNVHFIGTQGVGKSTLLRAILFFYNADKMRLGIPKEKKNFDAFYLPFANSYIVYEVMRENGAYTVVVTKSMGRAAFRFVDAPYRKEWFVNERNEVAADWSEIRVRISDSGYNASSLVTGYDIIGFWVSRMIFSGLAYTGKAPFDTVLIHGIVRDSQGRKMSKSLGNGIDPLKVIDEYGADALRMMLMVGSTAGNDMRYSDEKVTASRNFANKLWNASRFVQMNLPEDFEPGMPAEELLDMSDKWVLSELARTAAEVTANLDKYELGLAAEKVENFIWDIYCDWYIEICKSRLNGEDAQQADTARKVLVWVLDKALKLLHPFMPFITEEIYQALPGSAETIMTQEWPDAGKMTAWPQECADFEVLMDYIKAVRTIRNDMNVHPAKKTSMTIETANPAAFQKGGAYLARFAFATDVALTEKYTGTTDGVVTVVTPAVRGFIPMMELIDREKELKRLHKELEKAEKEANMFRNQLNNPKFVERAPEKLVNETRTKLAASEDKIANINQSIQALG